MGCHDHVRDVSRRDLLASEPPPVQRLHCLGRAVDGIEL